MVCACLYACAKTYVLSFIFKAERSNSVCAREPKKEGDLVVCVLIFVCVHARVRVRVYVRVHVPVHTRACLRAFVCVRLRECTCISV